MSGQRLAFLPFVSRGPIPPPNVSAKLSLGISHPVWMWGLVNLSSTLDDHKKSCLFGSGHLNVRLYRDVKVGRINHFHNVIVFDLQYVLYNETRRSRLTDISYDLLYDSLLYPLYYSYLERNLYYNYLNNFVLNF